MNANTKESLRLFFALWPDDETRTALMQLQAPIQGRRIAYDNLHLTLAFLGQQPASTLPALKQILTHLTPSTPTLTLDRVGYFTRNRIAWAGMHDVPDTLLKLQQELAQAIAWHDISFDNRHVFKPHVTLARDATLPPDVVFTPFVWRASQIVLVQSVTRAEGASYQVLASRSLDEECWTSNEVGREGEDST
jgi:2'-5' RNA ligase